MTPDHPPSELDAGRPVRLPTGPFRLWMTGSVAVVMAALVYTRIPESEERQAGVQRVLRHSAFGVGETIHRIELAARGRGMSVLARLDGAQPVLVLASSAGGTPVVMNWPDSPPDIPFAVHVRAGENGHAEVFVAANADTGEPAWQDLPAEVASDMAALADLLDGALSRA
jgi:hypothetical protein